MSSYRRIAATLAVNWWTFATRGALGIVFGFAALALHSLPTLLFVPPFNAYALVNGVLGIAGAVRNGKKGERSGLLIAEGLINVFASATASLWQEITPFVFAQILATRATLSGGLMLAVSFRLDNREGRRWFALGGMVSILYGVLLFISPIGTDTPVLALWFGVYSLAFGITLLLAAFKLKTRSD